MATAESEMGRFEQQSVVKLLVDQVDFNSLTTEKDTEKKTEPEEAVLAIIRIGNINNRFSSMKDMAEKFKNVRIFLNQDGLDQYKDSLHSLLLPRQELCKLSRL